MAGTNVNAEFQEITRLLYEVISAPNDQKDWDSVRPLFHPRATMVRTGLDEAGQPFALAMSHDEYIANATNNAGRGVNFFNLVNEGDGWKIMNMVWDNERPGVSLLDAQLL